MELAAAVVPHVACEYAPVRCEVDLEEAGHPVALAFPGGQILEFEAARKLRSPLVEQVSHEDVREADVAAGQLVVLVIFLRRVQKSMQGRKRADGSYFLFIDGPRILFDISETTVAKQVGYDFDIRAVLKDIRCKCVACAMPGNMFLYSCCFCPSTQFFETCWMTGKREYNFVLYVSIRMNPYESDDVVSQWYMHTAVSASTLCL